MFKYVGVQDKAFKLYPAFKYLTRYKRPCNSLTLLAEVRVKGTKFSMADVYTRIIVKAPVADE